MDVKQKGSMKRPNGGNSSGTHEWSFLDLPAEIRLMIYKVTDGATIKVLRFLCSQIREETEIACLQAADDFTYLLDWSFNPFTGEGQPTHYVDGYQDPSPEEALKYMGMPLDLEKCKRVRHICFMPISRYGLVDVLPTRLHPQRSLARTLLLLRNLFPLLQTITQFVLFDCGKYTTAMQRCFRVNWIMTRPGQMLTTSSVTQHVVKTPCRQTVGSYEEGRIIQKPTFDTGEYAFFTEIRRNCLPLPRTSGFLGLLWQYQFHSLAINRLQSSQFKHAQAQSSEATKLLSKISTKPLFQCPIHSKDVNFPDMGTSVIRTHHQHRNAIRERALQMIASWELHQMWWDRVANHYAHLTKLQKKLGQLDDFQLPHALILPFECREVIVDRRALLVTKNFPSPTDIFKMLQYSHCLPVRGEPGLYSQQGQVLNAIQDRARRPDREVSSDRSKPRIIHAFRLGKSSEQKCLGN